MKATDVFSFAKFCALVKEKNAVAEIDYGSGGYSVILIDKKTKKKHYCCVWDPDAALVGAMNKLEESRIEEIENKQRDTDPDVKFK